MTTTPLPPPTVGVAPITRPTSGQPSAPPDDQGATAQTVLFDTRAQAVAVVDAATIPSPSANAPSKLSQVARKVADREIKRAIVDLLDVGLSKVVLKAWKGHDALMASARRTNEAGGREVVVLQDHTITSTHTPRVALAVDGIDLGTLTISVVLTLRLIGITAVVERGELVAVETGAIAATGKLSVEDVPITSRSKPLDAVAVMKLDHPVRLAKAQATALPPPTQSLPTR
jgi:hypothetical protein